MRLAEFVNKPLEEALKELELKDLKVYTEDSGAIMCVELKYVPNKHKVVEEVSTKRLFKKSTMEDYY